MIKQIFATVAITAALMGLALYMHDKVGTPQRFLTQTVISDTELAFINFISKHQRTYQSKDEYIKRYQIFEENYNKITEHNQQNEVSYSLGVTSLADYSDDEYNQLLGYISPSTKKMNTFQILRGSNPDSVDWVSKGGVTDVKNQGSCGSCWAFSSTGALEGMNFVATGKLVSLSEQQLVDCAFLGDYGNLGCSGGSMDSAMTYSADHGLDTESDYPYTGSRGTCSSFTVAVQNTGHTDVTTNDPTALQTAVAAGPVSVAIEADKMVFQLYTGGIIDSSKCGTNLDHGVLVVGYGTDNGTDYWKLKNSWGTTWGEDGYFRILRDMTTKDAGICGLQSQPVYPTA